MPRTVNKPKELWKGVYEIEELWKKEDQESLAEMAHDAGDSNCHACEVRIRIAHKYFTRIPVEDKQPEA
jgi:hypothetical protein